MGSVNGYAGSRRETGVNPGGPSTSGESSSNFNQARVRRENGGLRFQDTELTSGWQVTAITICVSLGYTRAGRFAAGHRCCVTGSKLWV